MASKGPVSYGRHLLRSELIERRQGLADLPITIVASLATLVATRLWKGQSGSMGAMR